MLLDSNTLTLAVITFFAAIVNGALGYGFSSLTVPVALFIYTNRILNPALVLVEVVVNCYLLLMNRSSLPVVWKRVLPMVLGLFPGVLLGSYLLSSVNPGWIKLGTYSLLLPLILLQAAGIRRPIRSEKAVAVPFGAGIGFLYSVTTISGPPLALMFSNQGFVKSEFRAAIGMIRVGESSLTALAYYFLGLYTLQSGQILTSIVPSVIIGIPIGTYLIRQINPDTFRRICMSFDVWVVGFGLSKVLGNLHLINTYKAFSVFFSAVLVDLVMLYFFFKKLRLKRDPQQEIGFSKSLMEKEP